MSTKPEQPIEATFDDAAKKFDLERLKKDIEALKQDNKGNNGKALGTPWVYFKGVLCGYDYKEIASKCFRAEGTIKVALSNEISPHIVKLLNLSDKFNTIDDLGGWVAIPNLLEKAGYAKEKEEIKCKKSHSSDINWQEICKQMTENIIKCLTTNPLTDRDGINFNLDDIYVPFGLYERGKKPRVNQNSEGAELYQLDQYEVTRKFENNDEFFREVLANKNSKKSQGSKIAIIGKAGAGKSTQLQKIAKWIFEQNDQDIVIWVSLADLKDKTLEEYLSQNWLKNAFDLSSEDEINLEMRSALTNLFKSGKVWLLLDGLDEMGLNNPLATIADYLKPTWLNQARIILTCRLNVWESGNNYLSDFDVYKNLDFSEDQVKEFINKFFAKNPELGINLITELNQNGKERIRNLIKNPLRLTLLCQFWDRRQDQGGGLPDTKAGLYENFVNSIYDWKNKEIPTTSSQRKELNEALGKLALEALDQDSSYFRLTHDQVVKVLGEIDQNLGKLALDLGWLNEVGVAQENPDQVVYAFLHSSFQEYFTALAIDDWDFFLPKNHVNKPILDKKDKTKNLYRIFEKQWEEVYLFWIGRENIDKNDKENFIKKLIHFDDSCGEFNFEEIDQGFYEYKAYFKAAIGINELKNCIYADRIVQQIVTWSFGNFASPIEKNAQEILLQTDYQKVIKELLLVLNTLNPFYKSIVVDILGKIATGNKKVINSLLNIIETIDNSNIKIRWKVADTLGKIDLGNQKAINELINLIEFTDDQFFLWTIAESLEKIGIGNEKAIKNLIRIIENKHDELIIIGLAETLGKIDINKEKEILILINILENTQNDNIISSISHRLEEIAIGNDKAINTLINIIETKINFLYKNYQKNMMFLITISMALEKIAIGNKLAISRLNIILENTNNKYFIEKILAKITKYDKVLVNKTLEVINIENIDNLSYTKIDNEININQLINIIETNNDNIIILEAINKLANISVGNEKVIQFFINMLKFKHNIYEEDEYWILPELLSKLITSKNHYLLVVSTLNKYINNETNFDEKYFFNNKNRTKFILDNYDFLGLYMNCFELLWKCTEKLTYSEFYQAWHSNNENIHPEIKEITPVGETEITKQFNQQLQEDIYTQLKTQIKQDHINLVMIKGSKLQKIKDSDKLAKAINNQIFKEVSKTPPQIKDIFDLERELINLKLETDQDLLLIINNCDPVAELIELFEHLIEEIYIIWLTDQPFNGELIKSNHFRTFKPDQTNLTDIIQNWIDGIK